jgi:hypothetical protein
MSQVMHPQSAQAERELTGRPPAGIAPQDCAALGKLRLQSDDKGIDVVSQLAADPTGVDMNHMVSAMRPIEDVEAGRVVPGAAMEMIRAISRAPPDPTWRFLAAAAGAVGAAAAIEFASVVSMMRGAYLFRMVSGLVQIGSGSQTTLQLIGATTSDGMIAVMIILAMSYGLIIPKKLIDFIGERPLESQCNDR